MNVFGWIVLVIFALLGFAVVLYVVIEFAIVQIRLCGARISSELELLREDGKKSKELKRARLETRRTAVDKNKKERLNAKLNVLQKKTDTAVAKEQSKEKKVADKYEIT